MALIQSKLARGAIGSFVLRVSSTGIGFATSIVLARELGAEGYGTYSYAYAWANLLAIPAMLGLPELLVREVASFQARIDWPSFWGLVRWANEVVLLLSTLVAIVAVGLFGHALGWGGTFAAIAIALASIPLNALTALRQSVLRGLGEIVASQIPELLLRPLLLLTLVLPFYLCDGMQLSVTWATGAAAVAIAVSYLVGAWLQRRRVPSNAVGVVPRYAVRRWFAASLPFILISGMYILNTRADVIMLGLFRDQASVGVYSIVAKAAALITFALAAVSTALAPVISRLFVTDNRVRLRIAFQRSTLTVALVSLPIMAAVIVLGRSYLALFGPEFSEGYAPLLILGTGLFVNASFGPTAQLLNMTGHARDTAWALAASVVANVGLNALLIPRYGVAGAAIATGCSSLLSGAVQSVFVYRRFGYYSLLGIVSARRGGLA